MIRDDVVVWKCSVWAVGNCDVVNESSEMGLLWVEWCFLGIVVPCGKTAGAHKACNKVK